MYNKVSALTVIRPVKQFSKFQSKAWEKIKSIFNARTTTQRTTDQLRQKYESLKKETRKYFAKQRQLKLATGGGPSVENKSHVIYDKVFEIIKLSTEGRPSNFDSDALFKGEIIFFQNKM